MDQLFQVCEIKIRVSRSSSTRTTQKPRSRAKWTFHSSQWFKHLLAINHKAENGSNYKVFCGHQRSI